MTSVLHLTDKQDWTVDDVAKLPEDLRYELIDGRLVLTPSATPFHQDLSIEIVIALRAHAPAGCMVTFDQSVMLGSYLEFRPDVAVTRIEGANRTPVLVADMSLAVEIISPSSTTRDRREKLKFYAYGGIPDYWIVDPLGERITFTRYELGPDGAYAQRAQTDGLVTLDRPWPVTLDFPAWTRRRDEIRRADRFGE